MKNRPASGGHFWRRRIRKCVPHIEQPSLRHRGVSTTRLPDPASAGPLLMLVRRLESKP
jgi:hypothetical protein